MALRILQSGANPIGVYDALDSQLTSFKGGEVVTLAAVLNTPATDLGASDQFDGYAGLTLNKRPVVTLTIPTAANSGPLWLSDDGIASYGTLFGTVIGGTVGQISTVAQGAVVLGPHTATGSGKITCWDKQGLYGVTLDAVETTATTGLTSTNTTLAVGASLFVTPAGLLTPNSGTGTANGGAVIGKFIEFVSDGSLVTTPNNLVSGFASPSGAIASAKSRFTMAVLWFHGA